MIPLHVISYNLLTPLQQLVADAARLQDVGEIVIHDHASTYEPLLDWYSTCGVRVVRYKQNLGPLTLWQHGALSDRWFHVVTDCDLDISGVPLDVLGVLREGMDAMDGVCKCGLSLEIDDLPSRFDLDVVRKHEGKFWVTRRGRYWEAPIDTTFAMYRPERAWGGYGPALRTDRPYTARHVPWYWDPAALADEQQYYVRQKSIGTWWTSRLQRMRVNQ